MLLFIAGPLLQNLPALINTVIEECDEEEVEDGNTGDKAIDVADIPQAFSHFTYRITDEKKLVCDLQGVLTTGKNYEFVDILKGGASCPLRGSCPDSSMPDTILM